MSNSANVQQTQPSNYPVFNANYQNDDIDLLELFSALWQGKFIIVALTLIFAIGAVVYALNAQQWWSSQAKVGLAQSQDIAEYQQQVKQFQPLFDVYQDDGTILVSEELDSLLDTQILFQQFIDAFSSSNNKRSFLDSNSEFQTFKNALAKADESGIEVEKEATNRLYSTWYTKITANKDGKTDTSPYNLSFQATTKESSYNYLVAYIKQIERKVHEDALNNLEALVRAKRNELVQQKRVLTSQAKNRLAVEIERAKYALDIAKAANVTQPIQANSDKEIFVIDMGSEALAAKVTALETLKNLSVIEPRLQQIDAKLAMFNDLKLDRNIEFQTFRFIENVESPISRDKPKRALIVVLGTMLGGMLGVAIVLIRFAFRREEETEK